MEDRCSLRSEGGSLHGPLSHLPPSWGLDTTVRAAVTCHWGDGQAGAGPEYTGSPGSVEGPGSSALQRGSGRRAVCTPRP